jgi:hypothetical protein
MTASPFAESDLAAVTADLLAQGGRVDALSRLLTAMALFGLLLLPAVMPARVSLLFAVLVPAALIGLAESYLALRVGFDAALFRRLADPVQEFDAVRLDAALWRLRLMPVAKTGRAIDARIAGARRLLNWQGLMLGAQAVLIVTAAVLGGLPDWGGG